MAVAGNVAYIMAKVTDSWVWTSKRGTAFWMVIEAIRPTAPLAELTHALCRIIIRDTAFRMVVEAAFALASPPESTRVQRRVNVAALWVGIGAVAAFASSRKPARLRCLEPQDALLLTLPSTLLDDILRDGTEAWR